LFGGQENGSEEDEHGMDRVQMMESKQNVIEKLSKFVKEIPGIEREILTIFEIILHMKELRLFKDKNLK
jgi:hypothetical protein